jgi:hypothetical protein
VTPTTTQQTGITEITNPTAPINVAASTDSTHPDHAFNLGKVLATVLFGLQVYSAVQQSASTTGFFTNPSNAANLINGFTSIWVTK